VNSIAKKCIFCPWRFRCPHEQLYRIACRACESKKEEK
jgi:hypothetical protein